MDIRFQFVYGGTKGKELAMLPVNPPKLSILQKSGNKSDEVIGLGDITILKDGLQREFSIESFFPKDENAPHVLTKGRFEKPRFYINYIEKIRKAKKPVSLIIYGIGINWLVSIEDFEYTYDGGDEDVYYKLTLKQYQPHTIKELKIVDASTGKAASKNKRASKDNNSGFSIGDNVEVTGNYYYSSYGAEPHGVFNNFSGKISHIAGDKKRKYRYHITSTSGGYKGWVAENQLKHK